MPPSILQNVVEQLVGKLQKQQPALQIPKSVIRQTAEHHRLLSTRVRVGTLGSTDTAEKRAAVLLEWTLRKETGQRLLDWEVLAVAVHVKKKAALQQLQHVLLNYLMTPQQQQKQAPAPTKQPSRNSKNASKSRSLRNRNHTVNYKQSSSKNQLSGLTATTTTTYQPQILHQLVMRLAGHVQDPHGIQRQTMALLQGLHCYYDDQDATSTAVERRGHLYDLQRYAAAYEAAALYHIVRASTSGNASSKRAGAATERVPQKKKTRLKEKWSTRNDEALDSDHEHEHDDTTGESSMMQQHETLRPLQLQDLVEASTEFTYLELKQVLPRVQELAAKIAAKQENATNKKKKVPPAAAAKNAPLLKKQKWNSALKNASSSSSGSRRSNIITDANAILESTSAQLHCSAGDAELHLNDNDDDVFPDNKHFDEWKAQVLATAREQVRTTTNTALEDDEQAIQLAADNVLRKYDLLLISPTPQAAAALTE